ncbi:Nucleoid-associated protein [bacterium HR25]|jgi:DNA-binding YbaB/EbfC family protein|nr:Nucleoid-associated protein [bacterium HR25]
MSQQPRMNRDLMRQIQELQNRIAEAQRTLEETVVETSAGGGAVTVVMSARPQLQSITIRPEAVDPDDVEMLQDLILAAVNDALEKVREAQMRHLSSLAGGFGLPGLPR